jgi:hypothetical protein
MTIHYIVGCFHHVLCYLRQFCVVIAPCICPSSLWSIVWESNIFYVSEYRLHCLTLGEEHKLFESKMLRIIFNPEQEEVM